MEKPRSNRPMRSYSQTSLNSSSSRSRRSSSSSDRRSHSNASAIGTFGTFSNSSDDRKPQREARRQQSSLTKQLQRVMEDDSFPARQTELPLLKTPFNQSNSFFSNTDPEQILKILLYILKNEREVDIDLHDSAFKIRGRKFMHHLMCEFQVEMFRVPRNHLSYPKHVLVEFQRRSGDGMVFQKFVCEVFCKANECGIITYTRCTIGPCQLSPVPLSLGCGNLSKKRQTSSENDLRTLSESKLDIPMNDIQTSQPLPRVHGGPPMASSSSSQITLPSEKRKPKRRRRKKKSNPTPNEPSTPKEDSLFTDEEKTPMEAEMESIRMFMEAIASGFRENKRCAATYLAKHSHEPKIIQLLLKVQPDLIRRLSEVLLASLDPQVVRAIGHALCNMMQISPELRNQAQRCGLKQICFRVQKRWSAKNSEVRCGAPRSNSIVQLVPSHQVAERMQSCINTLQ